MSNTDANTPAPSPTLSPEMMSGLMILVRYLLAGPICTGLVAIGFLRPEDVPDFAGGITPILIEIGGFVLTVGWAWYARRRTALIKLVANMRGVSTVQVEPAIAAKVADPSVVPASPPPPPMNP